MITRLLSSKSLLNQFLVFNLMAFLILGFFTFLYLLAIEPELINKTSKKHQNIISNIETNLRIQKIQNNTDSIRKFLTKSIFILDEIDQIRFFDIEKTLILDSLVLDYDKSFFFSDTKIEMGKLNEKIISNNSSKQNLGKKKNIDYTFLKKINVEDEKNKFLVEKENINNNYIIHTSAVVSISDKKKIIITISEISNDIFLAIEERKNFVLRSVLIAVIVISIFSFFLNQYIINPIRFLNLYAKKISYENPKNNDNDNIINRDDEIGNLSRSLTNMTTKLYQRIEMAERFASDLSHEIRNPLASLKSASELLNTTKDDDKKIKLLKILSNDVERIERLITDYSQVLKDEASQSRSVAKEFNLKDTIESVIEDFNVDPKNLEKKITIKFDHKLHNGSTIFGIESRIEQVIANLLDNAVSFSPKDSKVLIKLEEHSKNYRIQVKDEGSGFEEKNLDKIFDRFYSYRPEEISDKHSGLGLNIVKNIIESHKGTIKAYNLTENNGAVIDIQIPKNT
ncbi:MAG: two-component sensor histidine kinase [Candidatus Pelagibacter sp.]|nr:two-component sensor histidine kinase [Candidatus Pelagibacter sp.]OUV97630.1 MAG: two-component sensor histidine kinase [Candidatus Pelagibacter sp. TMED142]